MKDKYSFNDLFNSPVLKEAISLKPQQDAAGNTFIRAKTNKLSNDEITDADDILYRNKPFLQDVGNTDPALINLGADTQDLSSMKGQHLLMTLGLIRSVRRGRRYKKGDRKDNSNKLSKYRDVVEKLFITLDKFIKPEESANKAFNFASNYKDKLDDEVGFNIFDLLAKKPDWQPVLQNLLKNITETVKGQAYRGLLPFNKVYAPAGTDVPGAYMDFSGSMPGGEIAGKINRGSITYDPNEHSTDSISVDDLKNHYDSGKEIDTSKIKSSADLKKNKKLKENRNYQDDDIDDDDIIKPSLSEEEQIEKAKNAYRILQPLFFSASKTFSRPVDYLAFLRQVNNGFETLKKVGFTDEYMEQNRDSIKTYQDFKNSALSKLEAFKTDAGEPIQVATAYEREATASLNHFVRYLRRIKDEDGSQKYPDGLTLDNFINFIQTDNGDVAESLRDSFKHDYALNPGDINKQNFPTFNSLFEKLYGNGEGLLKYWKFVRKQRVGAGSMQNAGRRIGGAGQAVKRLGRQKNVLQNKIDKFEQDKEVLNRFSDTNDKLHGIVRFGSLNDEEKQAVVNYRHSVLVNKGGDPVKPLGAVPADTHKLSTQEKIALDSYRVQNGITIDDKKPATTSETLILKNFKPKGGKKYGFPDENGVHIGHVPEVPLGEPLLDFSGVPIDKIKNFRKTIKPIAPDDELPTDNDPDNWLSYLNPEYKDVIFDRFKETLNSRVGLLKFRDLLTNAIINKVGKKASMLKYQNKKKEVAGYVDKLKTNIDTYGKLSDDIAAAKTADQTDNEKINVYDDGKVAPKIKDRVNHYLGVDFDGDDEADQETAFIIYNVTDYNDKTFTLQAKQKIKGLMPDLFKNVNIDYFEGGDEELMQIMIEFDNFSMEELINSEFAIDEEFIDPETNQLYDTFAMADIADAFEPFIKRILRQSTGNDRVNVELDSWEYGTDSYAANDTISDTLNMIDQQRNDYTDTLATKGKTKDSEKAKSKDERAEYRNFETGKNKLSDDDYYGHEYDDEDDDDKYEEFNYDEDEETFMESFNSAMAKTWVRPLKKSNNYSKNNRNKK